jgi:hypothetical protein
MAPPPLLSGVVLFTKPPVVVLVSPLMAGPFRLLAVDGGVKLPDLLDVRLPWAPPLKEGAEMLPLPFEVYEGVTPVLPIAVGLLTDAGDEIVACGF